MKKVWSNPEVKNLALKQTNEAAECPLAGQPAVLTPYPDHEWGDGKLGCTWNTGFMNEGLCTHPDWKADSCCWPCDQAPKEVSE